MSTGISLPTNGRRTVVNANGMNQDIISALEAQYIPGVDAVHSIAKKFKGHTPEETARNVWNFLKYKCIYKKDEAGKQDILTPGRFLAHANSNKPSGDCKSFSLFATSIFGALGYSTGFRYASYDKYNPTPSHVYSYIKKPDGTLIICDGVYNRFNAEAGYQYQYTHPMQISVLSGLSAPVLTNVQTRMIRRPISLENLASRVQPGTIYANVVQNAIARKNNTAVNRQYPIYQLKKYVSVLTKFQKPLQPGNTLYRLFEAEKAAAASGNFTGNVWHYTTSQAIRGLQETIGAEAIEGFNLRKISLKNIGKGIKRIGKQISIKNALKGLKAITFLAPRKAFLALAIVNLRGIASRLQNHPKSLEKATKIWVDKFGGAAQAFRNTIKKGSKKKPLFGGAIRGIEGRSLVNGIDDGIGVDPTITTAIIAAASPIILALLKLMQKDGVPPVPGFEGPANDGTDEAAANGGETLLDKAEKFIQQALPGVTSTGVVPEAPQTPNEEAVNKAIPQSDLEETGLDFGGTIGKYALPAVAIGAGIYLLTRKKTK